MSPSIQLHDIVSVTTSSTVLSADHHAPWECVTYTFMDKSGAKFTVSAHRINVCPDCGDELTFEHHYETPSYPECDVPVCDQCGYRGEPQ